MASTPTVQVQAETRGAVPEGAASFAVQRVSSLLRVASEPVLFARVKLTMAADPALERPAIAQVNIDLNGRLVRTQAAGETMREAGPGSTSVTCSGQAVQRSLAGCLSGCSAARGGPGRHAEQISRPRW